MDRLLTVDLSVTRSADWLINVFYCHHSVSCCFVHSICSTVMCLPSIGYWYWRFGI